MSGVSKCQCCGVTRIEYTSEFRDGSHTFFCMDCVNNRIPQLIEAGDEFIAAMREEMYLFDLGCKLDLSDPKKLKAYKDTYLNQSRKISQAWAGLIYLGASHEWIEELKHIARGKKL